MEQIRFDPLSLLHTKRSPQGAPQGSAAGDLFASLLDDKLKDGNEIKPARDPESKSDVVNTRGRRTALTPPRHAHQTSSNDSGADERNTYRLKAQDAAETHAARRERAVDKDTDEVKKVAVEDAESPGACVAAPASATTGTSATENSDATPGSAQDNPGQSTDGAADGQAQPQPDPAEQIADATAAAPTTPTLVPGPAPQVGDAATSAVTASNAVSPDEAAAIAQAAVAAAATALPEGSFGDAASSASQESVVGVATTPASDGKTKNTATAVNDNAAPEELIAASADQALEVGNAAAQPTQSAGVIFRQSSNSAKARAQGPGQGAADPQVHQSNQAPQPKPLVASNIGMSDPALDQANRANGGVATDSEFGTADQTGMGSWTQHLTPSAAGKNANFIANLRQQMQNLPVHEQVSIHIQRAISDRVGKLTVDLSPVELGRIQVKLKIDEENRVSASVTVERPGTLDLLQRDSRALERALQEAGLKTDSGSLSFTLQGGETGDFDQDRGFSASGGTAKAADNAENAANTAASARPSVIETADGLVDVEV